MSRLEKGHTLICVWERKLKPFDIRAVKIANVKGGGARGLAHIELENGISFEGSEARTRHIYQDKARLAAAPESPTRANVLIFSHGEEARKYLRGKGALKMAENAGIDFGVTERAPDVKASGDAG